MFFNKQSFAEFKTTKLYRFLKFGIVGFSGFIINLGILEILVGTHLLVPVASLFNSLKTIPVLEVLSLEVAWAAAISIECSIISNFTFNNIWTFSKHRIGTLNKIIKNFLKFNLTSIGAVFFQFFSLGLSELIIGKGTIKRTVTLILTILFLTMPYNWIIYNKVIWKTKKQTS